MRFARRVFVIAGVYGVIALIPQYFLPAPAQRTEFFYGFIGIALAWQVLFFVIATDPVRYRAAMPNGERASRSLRRGILPRRHRHNDLHFSPPLPWPARKSRIISV